MKVKSVLKWRSQRRSNRRRSTANPALSRSSSSAQGSFTPRVSQRKSEHDAFLKLKRRMKRVETMKIMGSGFSSRLMSQDSITSEARDQFSLTGHEAENTTPILQVDSFMIGSNERSR